ncbi:atlastin-like isoform X1 [Chironomus tepperi]|uniref:atlastin-like isoform X1 n=1 Tax=Chironomus tepperi TaxID=113505 RepID=UPI00391F8E2C
MASHQHAHGNSENVLGFTKDNKVFINDEPLKKMFLHADVKNRKIVAFSIIGAYRKGKSFFLDYCLRYLYAHYPSINNPKNSLSNPTDWLGDENEPLSGFSWRSGTDRDTTGIVMWNDVFLHTIERTGEKVAIVVMDTQGLFDNQTSPMDNSKIFALGTLISSIQVLNLSGLIQEDQLQYLQFATEFAKYAASNNQGLGGKCFQNLMFLIRDWENPDEYGYGINGGQDYLRSFLEIHEDQKEALKSVREFIHTSFEELNCFLLPHPGKIVTGTKRLNGMLFDGSHKGMDDDFKSQLSALIEHLLNPDRLVLKKFNGCAIKGTDFCDVVEQYFKLFQSDKLPQAQTIFDATVEKQMALLVAECVEHYKESVVKNRDIIKSEKQIKMLHDLSRNKALLMYNDSRKMGNASHDAKYKKILETEVDKLYEEWGKQTEESMKLIAEEVEKTRLALEEKQKAEREQIESERKAAERLLELEKVKASKELEHAKFMKEIEMAQWKFEAEQKRVEAEKTLEMERYKLQQEVERQRYTAEQELAKLKLQNENSRINAEKELEMEKLKAKMDMEREKHQRKMDIDAANQAREREALAAEKQREFELLKMEKQMEFEKFLKEKENAEARLEIERERIKVLKLEHERNEEIRKKLELEKENKKLKAGPCSPS